MLLVLFLLFTLLPIIELSILIQLGSRIGLFGTIGVVLLTGVLGAALARWQGMQTLWRLRKAMAGGEAPTDVLLDGAMILIAAAVLVTPGILTDLFGFALLTPPIRAVIKPALKAWFAKRVRVEVGRGATGFGGLGNSPGGFPPFGRSHDVVDGEVVDGEVVPEGEILEIRSETKDASKRD